MDKALLSPRPLPQGSPARSVQPSPGRHSPPGYGPSALQLGSARRAPRTCWGGAHGSPQRSPQPALPGPVRLGLSVRRHVPEPPVPLRAAPPPLPAQARPLSSAARSQWARRSCASRAAARPMGGRAGRGGAGRAAGALLLMRRTEAPEAARGAPG